MSSDTRIAADPVLQASTGTADIGDDELAELLATDPYVKRRGPYLTIETQPERLPERPSRCPECGEGYEKRVFSRRGEARYVHHQSGFGGDVCVVEADWQPQRVVTVEYERARRVSGR